MAGEQSSATALSDLAIMAKIAKDRNDALAECDRDRMRLITQRDQLREALDRTLHNFELILSQKPVRDAAETIAEARAALKATEEG